MLLIWAIGTKHVIPGTIGGAVPISTLQLTSSPPTTTTNSGIRERWRTKSKMKLRTSTFCLWWAWLWHKRDAQRRSWFAMIMEERRRRRSSPSTSGSRPREKISSMRRMQSPIPSPIHRIQACLVRLSTELSQGLNLTASNPIWSNF